jgi:hypothetical protein
VTETRRAADVSVVPPTRVVAAAVVDNPCAGRYVDDLAELEALGSEIAALLADRAVAALGDAEPVTAYGKGDRRWDGEIGTPPRSSIRASGPVRAAIGGVRRSSLDEDRRPGFPSRCRSTNDDI